VSAQEREWTLPAEAFCEFAGRQCDLDPVVQFGDIDDCLLRVLGASVVAADGDDCYAKERSGKRSANDPYLVAGHGGGGVALSSWNLITASSIDASATGRRAQRYSQARFSPTRNE